MLKQMDMVFLFFDHEVWWLVLLTFFLVILFIGVFSYFTNPFVRFTLVRDPNAEIEEIKGQFVLGDEGEIKLRKSFLFRRLAKIKAGWHIVSSRFIGGKKSTTTTVDGIIAEIHELRFDPTNPFLISGDHFSVLYPRSLGIFYHSLLDPRTALNQRDWERRQLIYLKTTAFALNAFQHAERLATTVVPVGPKAVAMLDIYAYASDTLYSLLYALDILRGSPFLQQTYPFTKSETKQFQLQTITAQRQLLDKYSESLGRHYSRYRQDVFDDSTGLVKKDLLLSGTKDIAKRSSALYDNVIFWRTTQLAQELEIIDKDQEFLDSLKQRILETFWLEEGGYFLEDLSERGIDKKYYSSDWLIVLMTGFLDPKNKSEQEYFVRSVQYIQDSAIDQPFGLQYHPDRRSEQPYFWVKTFAPDYASTVIWSHWGMEYIKTLLLLSQATGKQKYQQQAEAQLKSYTTNIEKYQGYPEVYDKHGNFYRQPLYKSIRQTGWIVNFEQARGMLRGLDSRR